MRLIALLAATFVATAPAAAQSWKEYAYPAYAFTVSFPAEPKIETTTYQSADGRSVEARVYSVTQDNAVFRMTIAELSDPPMDESAVIDHAIKTLSKAGEVKVDIPARINRVYGRQLSIAGADGSHSSTAIFYYKNRLYQIEGIALPAPNLATSAAIRFQQSLIFTGGDSNRAADAEREPRRNCRRANEARAAGAVVAGDTTPAEFDCRRRARGTAPGEAREGRRPSAE
jgi:hypothetical protein